MFLFLCIILKVWFMIFCVELNCVQVELIFVKCVGVIWWIFLIWFF